MIRPGYWCVYGDSPNQDLFAYGRTFFDRPHLFKLAGSVTLPLDFNIGAFIRYQSGEPFAREIEAPERMNQGYVTVNVEPIGSQRLDSVTTIDLRAAKRFIIGPTELELMLDVFNLTNENTTVDMGNEVNNDYETIYQILPPRIYRLGAKISF